MKNISITALLLLALASCAAPSNRINNMTPAEVIAYNRTVKYLERVYCTEEVSIGSHIPRRECMTYQDLLEGRTQSLNTPSSSSSRVLPF